MEFYQNENQFEDGDTGAKPTTSFLDNSHKDLHKKSVKFIASSFVDDGENSVA